VRIGHGFDVHRFGESQADTEITIGGVKITSDRPLLAHSDGDVLIHALCDALLGAAAMGDIGEHFPDTDAQYKGADSRMLLRHVISSLKEAGYQLINADITLVAQAPKMAPYKAQMRSYLAADMACELGQLNIKATTTEGLGYAGRKEGIACHAVVLLGALS
jgi:2-C-methyl-D-erythritol 2,4-cyclodiphosphate synthase